MKPNAQWILNEAGGMEIQVNSAQTLARANLQGTLSSAAGLPLPFSLCLINDTEDSRGIVYRLVSPYHRLGTGQESEVDHAKKCFTDLVACFRSEFAAFSADEHKHVSDTANYPAPMPDRGFLTPLARVPARRNHPLRQQAGTKT